MIDTPAHAALVIYVVWFVVAFGVRIVMHYQQTGTSGLKGLSPDAPAAEWWAGALLIFSILTGAGAPLLEETGQAPAFVGPSLIRWSGAAIALIGILLTFFAQAAMGRSWRVGVDPAERTELVTSGPFDIVRNPIFSTMVITMLGLTILVANVPAVAAFLGLVAAIEIQVRAVEEPHLRRVHGRRYLRYEQSVGRFYPGIGKVEAKRR